MRVMVTMVNIGGGHATSSEFVITPSLTCFEVRQETASLCSGDRGQNTDKTTRARFSGGDSFLLQKRLLQIEFRW